MMRTSDSLIEEATVPPSSPDLLIDLAGIDLSRREVLRPELERWNPHRGAIVQLDAVVWRSPELTAAVGLKSVRPDEFWVSGHFPGRPIMPGVLMIEAGAQLASYLFYVRRGSPCIAGFTRIDDTVFRGQVVPGDDLLLLCREVKYRPRRFISDIQGVVNGRLVFESRITGMVI